MNSSSHPSVFDRPLLDRRRIRALRQGDEGARYLLHSVAMEFADRLSLVERRFEMALEIGGHSGEVAALLSKSDKIGEIVRLERSQALLGDWPKSIVADDEALPLEENGTDLVLSPLALHLTNDTPGALIQIRRALRPDGLFLGAVLGGETLRELRASLLAAETELTGGASPRVAPFIDVRDAGVLLQRAGFALPVTDQDQLIVRYDSMFDLMRDLRGIGMTNMLVERSRRPVSRSFFLRAAEIYAERFSDMDGRVRATFDIVYLSGWKPHESQQKPLRPGSARSSLAEALRDRSGEYGGGD